MAVPTFVLFTLISRAATSVLTHTTTWLLLFGWFAVSQFDFGVAIRQLQQSIADLWWIVVLILLTAICNTAVRAYFQARRRGDQ